MPEAAKGPRLWLRRERRDRSGYITHKAVWFIRDDGRYQESTGCGLDDRRGAEQALAEYIARKRLATTFKSPRDPNTIPVADVIARYVRDKASTHSRPRETATRARALLAFFGEKMLSAVTGDTCRQYAALRSTRRGGAP